MFSIRDKRVPIFFLGVTGRAEIWRYWKGVDLSLVLSNFFSYEAFSIQIVHLQLLFPQKRLNSCFENFIIGLRAQKARMAAIAPAMDRSWMALA